MIRHEYEQEWEPSDDPADHASSWWPSADDPGATNPSYDDDIGKHTGTSTRTSSRSKNAADDTSSSTVDPWGEPLFGTAEHPASAVDIKAFQPSDADVKADASAK
jgi:hypothetical protein